MSSEIARGKLKIGSNLIIDFMPEYSQGEVETMLRKRGNVKVGDLLNGTFHTRVVDRIMWASGCNADDLAQPKITTIAKAIKSYPVKVEGLGDVSLSQVMSGGLNIREFDGNLMSMKSKNAYAVGEALDVDGDCGGYNLQWAWTSAKIVAEAIRKQY
jgi:predicted flavoprotein YhiN